VIFAPSAEQAPAFPILKPVEGKMGFRLIINPDAEREIPPPPEGFGPDDVVSSGMLGITLPRLYYELTFTEPGTYTYYCTIHALAGMSGSIEVR
jgi:hypothetical protein